VPHSASPTTRICGNAPRPSPRPLPGRPNPASLSAVSGTSKHIPSMATTRSPRYHAPRVAGTASGRTTSANNAASGSGPSRARALAIAAVLGTVHSERHRRSHDNPPTNSRITSS
jgi:hypothetical protein